MQYNCTYLQFFSVVKTVNSISLSTYDKQHMAIAYTMLWPLLHVSISDELMSWVEIKPLTANPWTRHYQATAVLQFRFANWLCKSLQCANVLSIALSITGCVQCLEKQTNCYTQESQLGHSEISSLKLIITVWSWMLCGAAVIQYSK